MKASLLTVWEAMGAKSGFKALSAPSLLIPSLLLLIDIINGERTNVFLGSTGLRCNDDNCHHSGHSCPLFNMNTIDSQTLCTRNRQGKPSSSCQANHSLKLLLIVEGCHLSRRMKGI